MVKQASEWAALLCEPFAPVLDGKYHIKTRGFHQAGVSTLSSADPNRFDKDRNR